MENPRKRALSPQKRAQAKRRYGEGESISTIAKELDINRATLKRIADRENWPVPLDRYFKGVQKQNEELAKRRAVARTRYEGGEDLNTVAEALALNPNALRRIARVERWSAPLPVCIDEAA
jgi:uncharacterized protein YjcR